MNDNEELITTFEIYHEEYLEENSFPKEFRVDFESFGKRIVKSFSILEQNHKHPIGSNKVFTLDENGIKDNEIDYYQV